MAKGDAWPCSLRMGQQEQICIVELFIVYDTVITMVTKFRDVIEF